MNFTKQHAKFLFFRGGGGGAMFHIFKKTFLLNQNLWFRNIKIKVLKIYLFDLFFLFFLRLVLGVFLFLFLIFLFFLFLFSLIIIIIFVFIIISLIIIIFTLKNNHLGIFLIKLTRTSLPSPPSSLSSYSTSFPSLSLLSRI